MLDLGERDLLAEIEYKIILVMFSQMCYHLNVLIVVFFTLEWVPQVLFHVWKRRGIQLQYATSPLDVTKSYTLNL